MQRAATRRRRVLRELRTRLAEEKARAERVVRVELEDVLARPVSAALDLCHDRGDARDLSVPDDTSVKDRVDNAQVAQLAPSRQTTGAVEERKPRRRPAATGRAVDLAVREDRDVALSQRILTLVLPEDDAVDVPELGLTACANT